MRKVYLLTSDKPYNGVKNRKEDFREILEKDGENKMIKRPNFGKDWVLRKIMPISKKKQDLKLSQQYKNYVHIRTGIQQENGK